MRFKSSAILQQTIRTKIENLLVINAKRLLLNEHPIIQFFARSLKQTGYAVLGDTEDVVRSGNWHGNDTCWRMALDLNRIMLYANPDGTLRKTPKAFFSVVDGIIGMQGSGPVAGKPKSVGLVIAGYDPVSVDVVCTGLMGFDYSKIPLLSRAFDNSPYPLTNISPQDISVTSNMKTLQGRLSLLQQEASFDFEPHFGWKGYI
jgi:hypothetical protein